MMLLFLPLGLVLPTLNGWMILSLLQAKKRILFRGEQWAMGCVLGLLITALLFFVTNVTAHIPLSRWPFVIEQLTLLIVLAALLFYKKSYALPLPVSPVTQPFSMKLKILIGVIGTWTLAKTLFTATVFLTLVPTYLDDSIDNWNLRAKVFFYDHTLTLAMPGENPISSPLGVSSYSPALPLMKTWLAALAGEWNEALINSIHIVWYIAAITLLYYALRRLMTRGWALLGGYIIASMPLYLMHGTNAYADAFVSVHVFIAVSMLFFFLREQDPTSRMTFMRIGAVAAGLLPFTKNEGLLLYLPPIILLLCIGLVMNLKQHRMSGREVLNTLLWYGISCGLFALPWLIFKWSHGLTFGNAKSISTVAIGWQHDVLLAWFVNTFFEGNWLFLFPLLLVLLLWRWRAAFSSYAVPTVFFLIVYFGQLFLFLFTGISAEAVNQTGIARGVIQQLPVIVFIVSVLLWDGKQTLVNGQKAIFSSIP
jgi:hypothetical protein